FIFIVASFFLLCLLLDLLDCMFQAMIHKNHNIIHILEDGNLSKIQSHEAQLHLQEYCDQTLKHKQIGRYSCIFEVLYFLGRIYYYPIEEDKLDILFTAADKTTATNIILSLLKIAGFELPCKYFLRDNIICIHYKKHDFSFLISREHAGDISLII
ncbi:hypothetical protein ACJX0J_009294, partial [Zea mays]